MPEQLPVWHNPGVEPTEDLKQNGWKPGKQPAAQNFDWLFNRSYKVMKELRETKADSTDLTEVDERLTEQLEKTLNYYTELTINIKMFGAHSLEEVGFEDFDSTAAIQEVINNATYGSVISGLGKTYLVQSLYLKSGVRLKDFNFISIAGNVHLQSPITIGSYNVTDVIRDIVIDNVHIDGNRTNQTNLLAEEDGGRHGFRLIGNMENIIIKNSSANYCGTDGICIYVGAGTDAGREYYFDNIIIENCQFNWNRRHGGSGDGIKNMIFSNCEMKFNGRELNGGVTEGDKATLMPVTNLPYGNGFDMEGYGQKSRLYNINFINCVATGNARAGILFYDPTNQMGAGFTQRENITLDNCVIDKGVHPDNNNNALSFVCSTANRDNAIKLYKDIKIINCKLDGRIVFWSVEGIVISNTNIAGGLLHGVFDHIGLDNVDDLAIVNQSIASHTIFTERRTTNIKKDTLKISKYVKTGEIIDLGLSRTGTTGVLFLQSTGGAVTGGVFAANVILRGLDGYNVVPIFELEPGNSVGDATARAVEIIATESTWKLKVKSAIIFGLYVEFKQ